MKRGDYFQILRCWGGKAALTTSPCDGLVTWLKCVFSLLSLLEKVHEMEKEHLNKVQTANEVKVS